MWKVTPMISPILSAARIAGLAVFFLGFVGQASAQTGLFETPEDDAKFTAYIEGGEHKALLLQLWTRASVRKCGAITATGTLIPIPERFRLLSRVEFGKVDGDDNRPMSGAWVEGWWGRLCGAEVLMNFVFSRHGESRPLQAAETLPGTTMVDPLVQIRAAKKAVRMARTQIEETMSLGANPVPSCTNDLRITDTVSHQDPRSIGKLGVWTEDWMVSLCDSETIVRMGFMRQPDGRIAVHAAPAEHPS
ncbi:MAG: hypothetical protein O7C63_03550 [Alphaproteobacteria bacterium]|nr:hypothetical protein [Alphaproteobacteria bacterium]